jgi:hypothetical protein
MPRYHSTDMGGAIKLFEQIDPEVEYIVAYGGADGTEIDIVYGKVDGAWRSHCMRASWKHSRRYSA